MLPSSPPVILAPADDVVFRGYSIGAAGHTIGEVVFNTVTIGYQEIPADPSYSHQIATLTYPHVGNIGVNREGVEATKVHATGLIIKDLPILASSFRKKHTLSRYLKGKKVVAIAGIDTRKLTRIPREEGAQNGCILTGEDNVQRATDLSRSFPGLSGTDLAKVVSVTEPREWAQTGWALNRGYDKQGAPKYHMVAYDFGVKSNILYMLAERGCRIMMVPARTSVANVLAHSPDGVFLSNGPGDPELCDYAIAATKEFLKCHLPASDTHLGRQIMGLTVGAKTFKMKTGYHDASRPVRDLQNGCVIITSQNHGFAVDPEPLPINAHVTHISLFDGMLQDSELTDRPVFCFQRYPEASPGSHDITYLFDRFITTTDVVKQ